MKTSKNKFGRLVNWRNTLMLSATLTAGALFSSCGDDKDKGPINQAEAQTKVLNAVDNAINTLNSANPPKQLDMNLNVANLRYTKELEAAFERLGGAIDKAPNTDFRIRGLGELNNPTGAEMILPASVLRATGQARTRSGGKEHTFPSGGPYRITGPVEANEIKDMASIISDESRGASTITRSSKRRSRIAFNRGLLTRDANENPITDPDSWTQFFFSDQYQVFLDSFEIVRGVQNKEAIAFFLGTLRASGGKQIVGINFDALTITEAANFHLRELQIKGKPTPAGRRPSVMADAPPRINELHTDDFRFDNGCIALQNMIYSTQHHGNIITLYGRTGNEIEISNEGLPFGGLHSSVEYHIIMNFLSITKAGPGQQITVSGPLTTAAPGKDDGHGNIVEIPPEVYYPNLAGYATTWDVWRAKGGEEFWQRGNGNIRALSVHPYIGIEVPGATRSGKER